MLPERIEKLKQEYAGQYVVIDTECAELARLKDIVGRVRTVNFNGRVLVEFDGPDRAWYDLELDDLKVVDKSQPNGDGETSASTAKKTPTAEPEPTAETAPTQKLSRLELARLQKTAPESAAKPNAGKAPSAK